MFFYLGYYIITMTQQYQWMQSFKAENQSKTILLLILFPVSLILILWIVLSLFFTDWTVDRFAEWWNMTLGYVPLILIGLGIWGIVSFVLQKDVMFWLSGAKPITRKDNPEVYNIVENLCISRWLPMPKIAIMNESWMNAFATWWRQKDSWIAFTSGLLQNLDKKEIEAVAWHELTHLINNDSLLMYVAYIFVWVASLAWQYLLRFPLYGSSSSNNQRWWNGWFIFWIALLGLWYLFYPLIRLAISRKREYMADLGSVELTRDNQAMISALRKISSNSYVSKANDSISSFFIAEPKRWGINKVKQGMRHYATDGKKTKTSIWDSHPSIDDRIARLQNY